MSKKIKEFIKIRDMHYYRPHKSADKLHLEIEESNERGLSLESRFTALLRIGASCYVPTGGVGEYTAWEIALEHLEQSLHSEIFSEIYPWVDSFMGKIYSNNDLDWETRHMIVKSIGELNDIVRWKK